MTQPPRDNTGATPSDEETIHLDQFLKLQGLVSTGGQAKVLIQGGEVIVNGVVETRRRRKLRIGDVVTALGETIPVESDAEDPPE
jgi:ribosome-associated protein